MESALYEGQRSAVFDGAGGDPEDQPTGDGGLGVFDAVELESGQGLRSAREAVAQLVLAPFGLRGRATDERPVRHCSTWTTAGVDDLLQPDAWADLGPDLGRLLRAPHLAAVDVWPAGSASRFGKADSAAESGDVPAANDLARGHSGRPHPGVARDLGIQPMTEACDGFHPFAADGQMTSGRPLSPVRCRLRLCVGRGPTLAMPLERADAYRFVIAR